MHALSSCASSHALSPHSPPRLAVAPPFKLEWQDPAYKERIPDFAAPKFGSWAGLKNNPLGAGAVSGFNRAAVLSRLGLEAGAALRPIGEGGAGGGAGGAFRAGRVVPAAFKPLPRPPVAKIAPEAAEVINKALAAVVAEDPDKAAVHFVHDVLGRINARPGDTENRVIYKVQADAFEKVHSLADLLKEIGFLPAAPQATAPAAEAAAAPAPAPPAPAPAASDAAASGASAGEAKDPANPKPSGPIAYRLKTNENDWPQLLPIRHALDAISLALVGSSATTTKSLKMD